MSFRENHYRFEWLLKNSPERLWPRIADTNRFNRDTGLAPWQSEWFDCPEGMVVNLGEIRLGRLEEENDAGQPEPEA